MSRTVMATKSSVAPGLTNEDMLRLPIEGYKVERVDGELILTPASWEHGEIGSGLLARLFNHVKANKLGKAFGPDLGFDLPRTRNLRCPDVSFVSTARFAGRDDAPFPEQAPDLVAEVVSPSEKPARVRRKVAEYIDEGTLLVWVIWPDEKRAEIYRPGRAARVIGLDEALDGEDVVPGFRVLLREILEVD